MSRDQMFTIGGDGNLQAAEYAINKRVENLREHMFYSVFLAFKNISKEITATEAIKIANEQMTMLGPAVGQKMNLQVLIQKCGLDLHSGIKFSLVLRIPSILKLAWNTLMRNSLMIQRMTILTEELSRNTNMRFPIKATYHNPLNSIMISKIVRTMILLL